MSKKKKIKQDYKFFVRVISFNGTSIVRDRMWGWYSKFSSAEKSVLENHTDIFEYGYYNMAVITKIYEGVCALGEEIQWYSSKQTKNSLEPDVKKIKKPKELEGMLFLI